MKETRYLISWTLVDSKTLKCLQMDILDGEDSWLFMKSKEEALSICKEIAERNFKELQEELGEENIRLEQIEDGWKHIDEERIESYKVHPIEIEY